MKRISVSEITTWLACRKRWQYRYEDNLEPSRTAPTLISGKAVHEVIEQLLARKIGPADVGPVTEGILQREFAGKDEPDALVNRYMPGVIRAISRFPEELFTGDWRIEEEVSADYMQATVFGRPDFVRETADELIIYELKSTSDRDKDPMDWLLWNPQHRMYASLFRKSGVTKPIFVEYVVVTTTPTDGPVKTGRWIMKPNVLSETDRIIDTAVFELTNDWEALTPVYDMHCRWCDYRSLCEARLTGRPEEPEKLARYVLRERNYA